eukprot:2257198-Prymnesium_polylepis.1
MHGRDQHSSLWPTKEEAVAQLETSGTEFPHPSAESKLLYLWRNTPCRCAMSRRDSCPSFVWCRTTLPQTALPHQAEAVPM